MLLGTERTDDDDDEYGPNDDDDDEDDHDHDHDEEDYDDTAKIRYPISDLTTTACNKA